MSSQPADPFNTRASEDIWDFDLWKRSIAENNDEKMALLHRALQKAVETELTPRQREMFDLYYSREMTMQQIAKELGVNASTVSRTLTRGRDRVRNVLKYILL